MVIFSQAPCGPQRSVPGLKRPVSEINEDVYESYFHDLARSYPRSFPKNSAYNISVGIPLRL